MYFPTSMSCFLVLCSITDQCDDDGTTLSHYTEYDRRKYGVVMKSAKLSTDAVRNTLVMPPISAVVHTKFFKC